MDSQVFDRIEKKYLITKDQKKKLMKAIRANMEKDDFFKSKILNIYFDTDNYDLIIQSIDQPIFKYKFRARNYVGYDRVFLEIKTKLRDEEYNPGYKRRLMITKKDYKDFTEKHTPATEIANRSKEKETDTQIAREIDYLVNHLNLKPKILVRYNRESYSSKDDIRITFDESLKYRTDDLSFKNKKHDKIYFEDTKNIIMEIKAHEMFPLWLVQALSENKLYSQQFSKIGKIYQKQRKENNV